MCSLHRGVDPVSLVTSPEPLERGGLGGLRERGREMQGEGGRRERAGRGQEEGGGSGREEEGIRRIC